jgi:hypothetical protein
MLVAASWLFYWVFTGLQAHLLLTQGKIFQPRSIPRSRCLVVLSCYQTTSSYIHPLTAQVLRRFPKGIDLNQAYLSESTGTGIARLIVAWRVLPTTNLVQQIPDMDHGDPAVASVQMYSETCAPPNHQDDHEA